MKLAALLHAVNALLIACSCAVRPPPPAFFGIDPAFSAGEIDAIVQAASDWNARLDERHQIRFELADWPWFIRRRAPAFGMAGSCTVGSASIEIRPGLSLAMVRAVARHELGHALELRHVRRGVMQATVYEDTEFSPEDLAECRRVGACV